MAFYGKYGTIKIKYKIFKFYAQKRCLELHVALWTVSQPNSKIFMIVVCLVSFHKIHIWRFMVVKFLLWWLTRVLSPRSLSTMANFF